MSPTKVVEKISDFIFLKLTFGQLPLWMRYANGSLQFGTLHYVFPDTHRRPPAGTLQNLLDRDPVP